MARIVCRLRIVLAEKDMTRTKLSVISGIPLNTLAPLFHDTWQRVDRKTVDRICNALNITYKELFENKEEQGELFKLRNRGGQYVCTSKTGDLIGIKETGVEARAYKLINKNKDYRDYWTKELTM